ncbi:hypothetical protein J6590_090901, partial [Homalodisca vitripennis]
MATIRRCCPAFYPPPIRNCTNLSLKLTTPSSLHVLRWSSCINTYKNKEQKEDKKEKKKGPSVPKSCLKYSLGVVTAQDASPEHKYNPIQLSDYGGSYRVNTVRMSRTFCPPRAITSKLKNKEERGKSRTGFRKRKFGSASACVRVRKNISRRNKCEVNK